MLVAFLIWLFCIFEGKYLCQIIIVMFSFVVLKKASTSISHFSLMILVPTIIWLVPNPNNLYGVVVKTEENSTQILTLYGSFYLKGNENLEEDMYVHLFNLEYQDSSYGNGKYIIEYDIKHSYSMKGFRKFVLDSQLPFTIKNIILMRDDESNYRSTMSLGFIGLTQIIMWILRPKIGLKKSQFILSIVSICGFIFIKPSLTLFRNGIKYWFPVHYQILIILTLFPGSALKPAFVLPYGVVLLSQITRNFEDNKIIIRIMMYSRYFYKFNIIEMFLYKFIGILMGLQYLSALLTVLSGIFAFLFEFITQIVNEFFMITDFFSIDGQLNIIYTIMVYLSYLWANKNFTRLIFFLCIFLMMYPPYTKITYINVNQGDATLIELPFKSKTYLIDTGKPSQLNKLITALKKHGIKSIDTLIITHDDLDHSGNITYILDTYNPSVIDKKGMTGNDFFFYLNDIEFNDSNENSLIFSTVMNALFTGDATKTQERLILKEGIGHHDILKLGHHGSKTSSDRLFVEEIQPSIAIVSSDPKSYGHPSLEVKRLLYNLRIPLIETSIEGDISIIGIGKLKIIITQGGLFGIIK